MSKNYSIKSQAWVSEDGSFSYGNFLITFDDSDALNEEQWDRLAELNDSERIRYAKAILDGDDSLAEWESDHE